MDRFESMSAFVAVVEAEGFSAAARKLGMPLATVSRKVSELEEMLRVSLINRSTRRITLTDSGQSFYEACRRVLDDLGEAERAASGEFRAPRGDLTVTAPIVFGRLHIVPIVVEFLKAYPDINVRLVLADRIVNVVEEQVDLAVRISELPDSSLVAVGVGEIRSVVSASPDYLNQYGVPRHPQDLVNHDCVTRSTFATPDAWPFRVGKGMKPFPVRQRLVVTTAEAAIDAAIAGAGLTRALCYQVCDAEKTGALVRVLSDFEPEPSPLSLVYGNSRKIPAKLRAFIDYTVPHLKQRLQRL
ncbi:MAG: LysR substrate-binding domain-containing protein [Hyphomicrobium sp.]